MGRPSRDRPGKRIHVHAVCSNPLSSTKDGTRSDLVVRDGTVFPRMVLLRTGSSPIGDLALEKVM
ncbi:MAG: hypothetical protein QCI82_02350 [Candidatus Thermoplasmatota archaeon]|nr:hypothetical protein [Candidatus Thermoplasmatota archaeon]